jgi:hypothetical protein
LSTLQAKIPLYLQNGARLVIVVDPMKKNVEFLAASEKQSFAEPEVAVSASYPQLQIDLRELFERL